MATTVCGAATECCAATEQSTPHFRRIVDSLLYTCDALLTSSNASVRHHGSHMTPSAVEFSVRTLSPCCMLISLTLYNGSRCLFVSLRNWVINLASYLTYENMDICRHLAPVFSILKMVE